MASRECGVHCGSWGTPLVCSIGQDRQEGAGIGGQLLPGLCNQERVFIRAVAGQCRKGIKTSRSSANHPCRSLNEPASRVSHLGATVTQGRLKSTLK